jgi:hypothetical protein
MGDSDVDLVDRHAGLAAAGELNRFPDAPWRSLQPTPVYVAMRDTAGESGESPAPSTNTSFPTAAKSAASNADRHGTTADAKEAVGTNVPVRLLKPERCGGLATKCF